MNNRETVEIRNQNEGYVRTSMLLPMVCNLGLGVGVTHTTRLNLSSPHPAEAPQFAGD